jgi:hypothetical protein
MVEDSEKKKKIKKITGGGGGGEDEINAIRTILTLEGYEPDKLAEGWRKQRGGNFVLGSMGRLSKDMWKGVT